MRVVVDRERCQGHGRCHAIAPELFDLDELGYSVLRSEDADILPALAEIAEVLCSCVDRDPDDLYDQFVTHDELKALFRGATSPPELMPAAIYLVDAIPLLGSGKPDLGAARDLAERLAADAAVPADT